VKIFFVLTIIFLSFTLPSICLAWSGKVVSVTDGDTIKVLRDGKQEKIRLYGIDTPEKAQGFGQKAKQLTASLVVGRDVVVQQKDVDRYGRIVGLVSVDGQSLNELIIQNGYAWVYRQYSVKKLFVQHGF
jgi:endonuclease YncB( thermonuclease family)